MREHGYRYFLAFRPPQHLVGTIAEMRDRITPQFPVEDHRLHVTVKGIAMLNAPDQRIATLIDAALGEANLPAIPLGFNRLESNEVAARLEIRGGPDPLVDCRAALSRHAATVGLPLSYRAPQRSHLTLGYGLSATENRAIPPVDWLADELVLIESWHGRHIHRVLGSWRLHPPLRQARFAFHMAPPQTLHRLSVS